MIGFAVSNFGMSLQDVLDMPWNEFILRSKGFHEKNKRDFLLVREVAYQIYCSCFIFSKKKPKSKDKFWQIGSDPKRANSKSVDAYMRAFKNYKEKKNG